MDRLGVVQDSNIKLSTRIDKAAKKNDVAVLGAGVNPRLSNGQSSINNNQ